MARNKIIYGNETLIDLTEDTAQESDVAQGKTFHKADGSQATGTATGGEVLSQYNTLLKDWKEIDDRTNYNKTYTFKNYESDALVIIVSSNDARSPLPTLSYQLNNGCKLIDELTDLIFQRPNSPKYYLVVKMLRVKSPANGSITAVYNSYGYGNSILQIYTHN